MKFLIIWRHTAHFKFWFSEVQDFGNFELSPMCWTCENFVLISWPIDASKFCMGESFQDYSWIQDLQNATYSGDFNGFFDLSSVCLNTIDHSMKFEIVNILIFMALLRVLRWEFPKFRILEFFDFHPWFCTTSQEWLWCHVLFTKLSGTYLSG